MPHMQEKTIEPSSTIARLKALLKQHQQERAEILAESYEDIEPFETDGERHNRIMHTDGAWIK